MQWLRSSSSLARLVLAWVMLTVGVAVASPIVSPQTMQLVCTTNSGMKLVVGDNPAEESGVGSYGLDCPLCLHFAAPAPEMRSAKDIVQPLAHALLPTVAATLAAKVGAPLPPRGPPASDSLV